MQVITGPAKPGDHRVWRGVERPRKRQNRHPREVPVSYYGAVAIPCRIQDPHRGKWRPCSPKKNLPYCFCPSNPFDTVCPGLDRTVSSRAMDNIFVRILDPKKRPAAARACTTENAVTIAYKSRIIPRAVRRILVSPCRSHDRD